MLIIVAMVTGVEFVLAVNKTNCTGLYCISIFYKPLTSPQLMATATHNKQELGSTICFKTCYYLV